MSNPAATSSSVFRFSFEVSRLRFERKQIVERLAPPDNAPGTIVHQYLRRQRTAIVIGGHDGAISTRIANRDKIPDFERRQHAVAADDVAAFADGSDKLVLLHAADSGAYRLDQMECAVQRRPHQLGHAGVDDRKLR